MPRRRFPEWLERNDSMSALFDELSKKARSLSVEERAWLAQELLESVERDADPDVKAAWESEIASRIEKYERGEATLIPAEEVFAAARCLTQ
jgi:putative addiction module component (TIGR02574 family)